MILCRMRVLSRTGKVRHAGTPRGGGWGGGGGGGGGSDCGGGGWVGLGGGGCGGLVVRVAGGVFYSRIIGLVFGGGGGFRGVLVDLSDCGGFLLGGGLFFFWVCGGFGGGGVCVGGGGVYVFRMASTTRTGNERSPLRLNRKKEKN